MNSAQGGLPARLRRSNPGGREHVADIGVGPVYRAGVGADRRRWGHHRHAIAGVRPASGFGAGRAGRPPGGGLGSDARRCAGLAGRNAALQGRRTHGQCRLAHQRAGAVAGPARSQCAFDRAVCVGARSCSCSWRMFAQASRKLGGVVVSPRVTPSPCRLDPAQGKLHWNWACARSLLLAGGAAGFLSGLLGVGGTSCRCSPC